MSDDLERRLADALQEQRLPDAPDTLRAFLERLPAEADARPPERRLRPAWLAPGLVVVVVAALLFALVPRSTNPPANSPSPGASVPAISGITWSKAATDSDSPLRGASVVSITAFGDGFVMVGRTVQPDGPVWWYSPDGTSWQRHDADPVFGDSRLTKVIATRSGLVIVGRSSGAIAQCGGEVPGCNPIFDLRMWTSSDGQRWQAVPVSSLVAFDRAEVWDVTEGPAGLVAVGAQVPLHGDPTGMIWVSSDGRSWAPASQFSSAFQATTVAAVAATSRGYFAAGWLNLASDKQQPEAWFSPDGRTWQQAQALHTGGSLVAVDGGIVTATQEQPGVGTAWVTRDGSSWQQATEPPFAFTASGPVLLSDGTRILAIGTGRTSGTSGAWTSTNGQSWQAVPEVDPPPTTFASLPAGALGPQGAVLLGTAGGTSTPGTTELWFGAFGAISQATPQPNATSVPLTGATVYTAPFVYPMPDGAWSPDGQFLAAEDGTNSTVLVFTKDHLPFGSHPGRFAAWVGPAALAVLVPDANDPTHSHLSVFYLQDTGPLSATNSAHHDLTGTYLPFMLAAPDGALAVLTGEDATGPGFVLVNPVPGPAYDGDPLAWSPDGRLLAFGVPADRLHQETLGILDVTTGAVRNTGLRISDQGVTWDRTSTKLLVGLISGAASVLHPALIDVASGTVTNSPIEGEITRAGQLADGRWIINAAQIDLWDPSQPGQVVPLGDRIAVSPLGAVAVFEPGSGESPAPLTPLPGVQVIHIAEPMPDFWAFSPDGSHFAYTEASGTQMQLKIAALATTGG